LGEDLLARVVHGSRVSLVVGLVAPAAGLVVGGLVGLGAANASRAVDTAVMVLVDAAAAFPPLVLAMSATMVWGQDLTTITATVATFTVPSFARVARTAAREVVHRDFVLAARGVGARPWRLITREVLPNVAVALLSYAFVVAGTAMLVEGALSFLGVGVGADKTSWGQLVAAGQGVLRRAPHVSAFPALALLGTVLALAQLAEAFAAHGRRPPRSAVPKGTARRGRAAAGAAVERARGGDDTEVAPAGPGTTAAGAVAGGGGTSRPVRLEVRGLTTVLHTGDGDLPVVQDISLGVAPGGLLGIVGESGSGKTMLARSLVALAPYGVAATFSGSVRLDGRELFDAGFAGALAARGRGIAQVLQDPMTALDPVMRIGDQIAELARVHRGADRRQARQRARDLLDAVGIGDAALLARRFPHELSGGQRQRAAVAIALAAEPAVLVADEPTSALDVTTQATLLDLIDGLRHRQRLAVVLISHDLALLARRADHVAVLYSGRIVEHGAAAQLVGRPRHPYTAALLRAAPRLDQPAHTRLPTIGGTPPTRPAWWEGCAFAPRCPRAAADCLTGPPPLSELPGRNGTTAAACRHPLD
jgi:peptide/nickel transport system permease protein